jgi:hypothetical protein
MKVINDRSLNSTILYCENLGSVDPLEVNRSLGGTYHFPLRG